MTISKRLLQRLSLIPWTCLAILLLNFILMHKVQIGQHLQRTPFFEDKVTSIEEALSHPISLEKPLLLNRWPWMSEKTLRWLKEKKDPNLQAFGVYALPALSLLYQKTLDPEWLKLLILAQQQRIWQEERASIKTQHLAQLVRLEQWQKERLSLDLNHPLLNVSPVSFWKKCQMSLTETLLWDYFNQVAHLNFGTLKSDQNQKVVPFAFQRLKSSLLFLIFPILFTFIGAQIMGILLALKEDKLLGTLLSFFFAILYAIPIYVMIPLLIEKVGLPLNIPIHGTHFYSLAHYLLPLIAVIYGAVAIYSRLEKTLFIQLFSRDYLLVGRANGLSTMRLVLVHSLREAALTTVPLLLSSLNFFMGTLVIVETLFEIDGFGRFFYQSILQHDTNATLFCILIISLLSMIGYLLSDLFLYRFDPRIRCDGDSRVF